MSNKYIIQSNTIKQLLSTAAEFNSEGLLDFNGGLHYKNMDDANISLIDANIEKGAFKEIAATPFKKAVEFERINQALKDIKDAWLEFEDGGDNLILTIKGDFEQIVNIPVIEFEQKEIYVPPELNHKTYININPKLLYDAIRQFKNADATGISFIVADGTFTLSINQQQIKLKAVCSGINAAAKYSVEYLLKFLKQIKKADACTISFNADAPLKAATSINWVGLNYLLAPMVV